MINMKWYKIGYVSISILFIITVFSGELLFAETKVHYPKAFKDFSTIQVPRVTYQGKEEQLMNQTEAKAIGQKLINYSGAKFPLNEIEDNYLRYKNDDDRSAVFDINLKTGEFIFNKGMAKYHGKGHTANLPSETIAYDVAMKHLDKLNLLPDKSEMRLVHTGGVGMATKEEDGSTNDYKKLVTVYFGRTLAGLPVVGASRIVVRLGENGELAALILRWAKVEKREISDGEILDINNIRSRIEKRLLSTNAKAEDINISKAEVVMYDDGEGTIEPALSVLGKIKNSDNSYSCDDIIPLLKNPKAKYPNREKCPMPDSIGKNERGENGGNNE